MPAKAEMLTLRIAREHVEHYKGDTFVAQHQEAMDCFDCEAFLQLGIDAFRWLLRADYVTRQAICRGLQPFDAALEQSLQELFRAWLEPCDAAERWAQRQLERGYAVWNLDEFRTCCEEARAIVDFFDDSADGVMTDALIALRDQAVQEFNHGETAEYF